MRKVNRKLVALDVNKQLEPFNGSFAMAKHLVNNRHMSPKKLAFRIKTAENAGLIKRGESNGLTYLGLSEPMFLERLRTTNVGLTLKQRTAFSFLIGLKVPEEMALRLSQTQMASRELFLKRAKVIADIRVDPKKYGIDRVPVSLLWKVIDLPPTKIRRYIEARVFSEFETKQSQKVLDNVFPVWRRVKQISRMEPTTVLAKIEWLIENGVSLHGRYIRQYSLAQLKQVKSTLQKMTPQEMKLMKQRLAQAKSGGENNASK